MTRLLWLPSVLRHAGIDVYEIPGWQARGTASIDPRVLVVHHTASSGTGGPAPSLRIVRDGRPDLPGPLSNILTGRDGIVRIVAAGVSNNAGRGQWLSATNNRHTIGNEIENDGVGEPWSPYLMDVVTRTHAAICRHLSWGPARVVGHKEWSIPRGRKIDPSFDMDEHRAAVGRAIVHATNPTTQGDCMLRDFIDASYDDTWGFGTDPKGRAYWWRTAAAEAPDRHWTYADCLNSPTLAFMVSQLVGN